jgi:hypothetical protein
MICLKVGDQTTTKPPSDLTGGAFTMADQPPKKAMGVMEGGGGSFTVRGSLQPFLPPLPPCLPPPSPPPPPPPPSLAASISDKRRRERGPKRTMRRADYLVNGYQECPGCMANRTKGKKKGRCSHKPRPALKECPTQPPPCQPPPMLGKRKVHLDRALHAVWRGHGCDGKLAGKKGGAARLLFNRPSSHRHPSR